MKDERLALYLSLLLIAQILVNNYFNFSQLVTITILPVLILCIPIKISSSWLVIIAFFAGFIADFFSTGALGLTSAALLPVGILRNSILKLIFGEELFLREEELSTARQGSFKIGLAVSLSLAVFLVLYIWLDAAGTRPFWFNAARFGISFPVSFIASLLISKMLRP